LQGDWSSDVCSSDLYVQSDNPSDVVRRLAMDAAGLRVERVQHDSAVVYRVAGEVDTLTAPHLDLALTDTPWTGSRMVLDMTEVRSEEGRVGKEGWVW